MKFNKNKRDLETQDRVLEFGRLGKLLSETKKKKKNRRSDFFDKMIKVVLVVWQGEVVLFDLFLAFFCFNVLNSNCSMRETRG